MAGLKNEVSFSASKASMLRDCPRQYWYSVYRSWDGWRSKYNTPEPKAEEAYSLKQANNLAGWAGSIVHGMAERGLRWAMEGRHFEREELRNDLLTRAAVTIDRGLNEARHVRTGNPKDRVQLVEVLFDQVLEEDWLRDRVRSRIAALTAMDDGWSGDTGATNLYLRACSRPKAVISVEDLMSFELAGLKVYFKLDLMLRGHSGDAVIVDWKTGKATDDAKAQVKLYATWAASRGYQKVTTLLVYLGDGTAEVVKAEADPAEARRDSEEDVKLFAEDIRRRLIDRDLAANRPVESLFEPTSDPNRCRSCPFQGICERDGTKPRQVAASKGPA